MVFNIVDDTVGTKFLDRIGFLGKSLRKIGTEAKQATSEVDGFKAKIEAVMHSTFSRESKKPFLLTELGSEDLDKMFAQFNTQTEKGTKNVAQFMDACSDTSFKKYIASVENGTYTVQGYRAYIAQTNTAIKSSGVSARIAAVGFKLLAAAMNTIISLGISAVISLITESINECIHRSENLRKNADELSSSYKELKSEAESVAKELETVKNRMSELEAKGPLTIIEKDEYNNLVKQNDELERTLKIKQEIEKAKGKEASDAVAEAWNDKNLIEVPTVFNPSKGMFFGIPPVFEAYEQYKQLIKSYTDSDHYDFGLTAAESVQKYIDKIEEATEAKKQLNAAFDSGKVKNFEQYSIDLQEIDEKSNNARKQLLKYEEQFQSYYDTLSESGAYPEIQKSVKKYLDDIIQVTEDADSHLAETLNNILSQDKFAGLESRLHDLAQIGVLSSETFESDELREFVEALDSVGLSIEDVTYHFIAMANAGTKARFSIADMDEYLDNIQDGVKSLTSFSEKALGGDFGTNDIIDFIQDFQNDLDNLNIDYGNVNSTNLPGIIEQIKNSRIDQALFELTENFTGRMEDMCSTIDALDRQINGNISSWERSDFEKQKAAILDDMSRMESRSMALQAAVAGLRESASGLIEFKTSLSALSSGVRKVNGYFDEYNQNGYLSLETINQLLSAHPEYARYLVKEGDQYKINQAGLDALKKAQKLQAQAADDYVQKLKEETFGTKEFTNTFDDFLDTLNGAYDDQWLKDISKDLKLLNQDFRDGKATVDDYFDGLQDRISEISFSDLGSSEAAQGLFSGLTEATVQGLDYVIKQFRSGSTDVNSYADSLQKANQNLLSLYTTSKDLKQGTNGMWADAEGQTDKYANNLQDTLSRLSGFNEYVDAVTSNIDYLSKHMDDMGNAAFTASDTASASFADMASSLQAALNTMSESNAEAFDEIVDQISAATGLMTSEILDGNGKIKDGLLNDSVAFNSALQSSNGQLTQAINQSAQAAGNVISALGDVISGFDYKISFTPTITQAGDSLISALPKLLFGIGGAPNLPSFEFQIKGSGGEAVKALSTALKSYGSSLASSIEIPEITLANFKIDTPQYDKAAPQELKKKSKAQKEVNEALKSYMALLSHRQAMDYYDGNEAQYIEDLEYALKNLAKTQEEVWDLEERIHAARKQMLEEEKRKAKEAAEERKRLAQEAYEEEGKRLNQIKSEYEGIHSAIIKLLDKEIEKTKEQMDLLGKQLELKKQDYDRAHNAVLNLLDKEIKRLEKENQLVEEQNQLVLDQLNAQREKYEGAHAAIIRALDKEIDKLQEQLDIIGKQAEAKNEQYQKAHAAVMDAIEEEIKGIEKQKKELDNLYQPQIDAIQEQIDKLNEKNEAAKKEIELEKARQELERANSQKTVRLYKEGEGFGYEADQDEIEQARENLRELEIQGQIDELESQKQTLIDKLNEEKEALDAQIDALQEYKEKWSDILDEFEKEQNREIADLILGSGWQDAVKNGDTETLEKFRKEYLALQKELADIEKEKEAIQDRIEALEDYKQQWNDLLDQYKNNQDDLNASEILGADWEKKILEGRLDILKKFGKEYLDIQTKLANTEQEKKANEERIKMLQEYRDKWAEFLTEYQDKQDAYIASQILGANWEQEILSGRLDVLNQFRNDYLIIQEQLADVEREKEAYQKRIDMLEGYKDKWSDVLNSYQDTQNALLAEQEFGADWEAKILSGRLDILENFKNKYISIMQQIGAWENNRPSDDLNDYWGGGNGDGNWWDDPEYIGPRPPDGGGSSGSQGGSSGGNGGMPSIGQPVTVKPGATHWASGSGGVGMDSWVPGSTLTVMQIKGNQVLLGRNGQWTGWIDVKDLVGYKNGTFSATKGLHRIDEDGLEELVVRGNPSLGKVTHMETGDGVIPNSPTKELVKFAERANRIQLMDEDTISRIVSSGLATQGIRLASQLAANMTSSLAPLKTAQNEKAEYNFHIDKLEFPNVKSAAEVEKAILDLPLYCMQQNFKR